MCIICRAVKQLISLIVSRSYNAHFLCYVFNLFVLYFQVDVVGPSLLNAIVCSHY